MNIKRMKIIITAIACSLMTMNCRQPQGKVDSKPEIKIDIKQLDLPLFEEEKSAFDFGIDDSTLLVYSSSKAFDSTVLLILSTDGGFIRGKIYFYPPTYYVDFPNLDERKHVSYNAINFIMSKENWHFLSFELENALRLKSKRDDNLFGKLHPWFFKIYFNSIAYSNEEYADPLFVKAKDILYKRILSDLLGSYPQPQR